MIRRDLVLLLSAMIRAPQALRAQQKGMPVIGVLLGDGVDAPRRHLCAKVTVSNCHRRRRPWSRLPRSVWTLRSTCSRCMERMLPGMCCSASGSNPEGESTEAGRRGGGVRSSHEGHVMGLERRGCVVRPWPRANWKREEPVAEAKPFKQRLNIGSRVTREGHARFWERPEVKFLRATRRTSPSRGEGGKVRSRRILLVATRPGEGRL